jgi:hypothetical protein
MATSAPAGIVVTTGNSVEGPARMCTDVVAKPGRAMAAAGAPMAAAKIAAMAIRTFFIDFRPLFQKKMRVSEGQRTGSGCVPRVTLRRAISPPLQSR